MSLLGWLWNWFRPAPAKNAAELLAEAQGLLAQGKGRGATRICSQIRRRDWTAEILVEMGKICLAAEFALGALDYAREARERYPNCAEAFCILGEVLLRERRETDALEQFREACQRDPQCGWAAQKIQ